MTAPFDFRALAGRAGEGDPDAELLALCAELLALEREFDRLFELQCAAEEAGDKALARHYSGRQSVSVPDVHDLVADIAALPARTEAGRRGKARVMLTRIHYDSDGEPGEEDALAHSICQDILAGEAA
jgi:hypothetical protein